MYKTMDKQVNQPQQSSQIQSLIKRRRERSFDTTAIVPKPVFPSLLPPLVDVHPRVSPAPIRHTDEQHTVECAPEANAAPEAVLNVPQKKSSPCPIAWASMSGSDKVRWCEPCQHFVYNPKGLSLRELHSLIWFREGVQCSVLYQRRDGMVMASDCRMGSRKLMFNTSMIVAVGAGIISMFLAVAFSHAPEAEVTASKKHETARITESGNSVSNAEPGARADIALSPAGAAVPKDTGVPAAEVMPVDEQELPRASDLPTAAAIDLPGGGVDPWQNGGEALPVGNAVPGPAASNAMPVPAGSNGMPGLAASNAMPVPAGGNGMPGLAASNANAEPFAANAIPVSAASNSAAEDPSMKY